MQAAVTPPATLPIWREGVIAARANLLPGLFLWALALAVVSGYYLWPSMNNALGAVARIKSEWGFLYSFLATMVFGGLIPFIWFRLRGIVAAKGQIKVFLFFALFWGYRGIEVDALYHLQSLIFGNGTDAFTVFRKVLVDMFIYNVIWASGLQTIAYHWKDQGFSSHAFTGMDWRKLFTRRIPVTIIATWGVWIPVVAIVYSLPSDLQIPLFNIAICFWVLVVSTLTKPKTA